MKSLIIKFLSLSFYFVWVTFICIGQGNSSPYDPLPKLVPPTPEAAGIQKFGETEVSLFNGSPSIGVPLYTLNSRKLSVPISLAYNSGGFKVGELSSNVGLGWSLQCGGMINVNIKGQYDFKSGRLKTPDIKDFYPDYEFNNADYTLAKEITDHNFDTEPDIFNYNMPGRSGKFVFNDSLTKAYIIPFEKIKIERLSSNNGFILTDEGNVKYYFQPKEVSNPAESCTVGAPSPREVGGSLITGWLLSKIVHPAGDSVVFEYETYNYQYREGISETRYQYQPTTGCAPHSAQFNTKERKCTRRLLIYAQRLKRVISLQGKVEFFYNSVRQDIDYYATNNDAKGLDSIVIKNLNGLLLKKYIFHQEYFLSPGIDNAPNDDKFLYRRLKLESLEEVGIGAYAFKYNEVTKLPNRLSNSQDLLGYNTGLNSGSGSFIPCGTGYSNCIDRSVNIFSQEGFILKSIKYPTGGNANFSYEPHNGTSTKIVYDTTFSGFGISAYPEEIVNDSTILGPSTYHEIWIYWDLPDHSSRLDGQSNGLIITPNGNTIRLDSIGEAGRIKIPYQVGKYKLHIGNYRQFISDASISMTWIDTLIRRSVAETFYRSGIRIKEIVDSSGFEQQYKKRKFSYSNAIDMRSYQYKKFLETRHWNYDYNQIYYCDFIQFTGQSVSPYGTDNDYQIGYKEVQVQFENGDVNGGREAYSFYTDIEGIDSIGEYTDYLHFGKLKSKKVYKYDPINGPQIVKEETYKYSFLVDENDLFGYNTPPRFSNKNQNFVWGIRLEKVFPEIISTSGAITHIPSVFSWDGNIKSSFWQYLSSIESKLFQSDSKSITTKTINKFGNNTNLKITTTTSLQSNGTIKKVRIKYIEDYPIIASTDPYVQAISSLKSKGYVGLPIEEVTSVVEEDGNEYITDAILTVYKDDLPLPSKIYKLENISPVLLADFVESSVSVSGVLLKDSKYKEAAIFAKYDGSGNYTSYQKASDVENAVIWAYDSTYVVCQVINAALNDIAYTSFETNETGGWSGVSGSNIITSSSITGNKSYSAHSFSFNKNGLNNTKTYIISYWSKNGSFNVPNSSVFVGSVYNGWQLFKHKVVNPSAGSISVSGDGMIDELRLYPYDTEITTYTYSPLVGITSHIDKNDRIIYYEYDVNNRLSLLRDQNNNILKKYCYNYTGQLETCGLVISAVPNWQASGVVRCKPCPANSSYISTVQEKEEKDLNPNSSTYNQIRWVDIGPSIICTVPADWQVTSSATCLTDGSGNNTGYQQYEEKDMNPCSPTYNTTRTTTIYNTSSCPIPSSCDCTSYGQGWACIGGVCEQGIRVNTNSVYDGGGAWICTYHYEFSDGSWSTDYQELGGQPCEL